MSAVGSSTAEAVETSVVRVPTILVFADSMPEMMPVMVDGIEVGADKVGAGPPDDPVPGSRLVRLDSDRVGSDGGVRADRSPRKAPIPCCVPLIRSGPRAVV